MRQFGPALGGHLAHPPGRVVLLGRERQEGRGFVNSALFESARIAGHEVPNRLFMATHSTNFAIDNLPSDEHAQYLRRRAQSGMAFILSEGIRVMGNGAMRSTTLGGWDDGAIPGFRRMVDATHEHGVLLFGQLLHVGREAAATRVLTPPWAVSITDWSKTAGIAHRMSVADISEMIGAYVATAVRLERAGFDAVEVHAGHGHMLHQFLSPVSNRRDDEYGGSVERRVRVLDELLTAICTRLPRLPVGIRVSAHEFLPGGLEPDIVIESLDLLAQKHELAFINVSHSNAMPHPSMSTQIADMSFPAAPFRQFPPEFKKSFPDIPVLAVCRYDDEEIASTMVTSGETDFIGLARAHIADPDIVAKWRDGRIDEVRTCIACNDCIARMGDGLALRCAVNADAGLESSWALLRSRAVSPRSVLVVGGGPAGLSAAAEAAQRGHRVVLVEADQELGGRVAIAARMHGRERIGRLVTDLLAELDRCQVTIRTGFTVNESDIASGGYDDVVLCTGTDPWMAPYQGAELGITPEQAITEREVVGDRVVIVDHDGGYASWGLAEHLSHLGHSVQIITPSPTAAWRVSASSLPGLIDRLGRSGVVWETECQPLRLDESELVYRRKGVDVVVPIDTAIVSHPGIARDHLAAPSRILAGDALAPRGVLQAVHDGRLAGASVGASEVPFALRWGL